MCCGNPVLVVDLAVRGQPAVEIRSVPGGHAFGAIVFVVLGHVHAAGDLIGLADAIGAAALGDRLAFLDHARAGGDAVARVDLARELIGRSAIGEEKAGERREQRTNKPRALTPRAKFEIAPPTPHHTPTDALRFARNTITGALSGAPTRNFRSRRTSGRMPVLTAFPWLRRPSTGAEIGPVSDFG